MTMLEGIGTTLAKLENVTERDGSNITKLVVYHESNKTTMERLEPMIQSHENNMNRQIGYQVSIALLSGGVGAGLGILMAHFWKVG